MTGPFGGAETPDENCGTCPMCAMAVREREAAEGIRCTSCLGVFDPPIVSPSEAHPEICTCCARVADAPKFPPMRWYEHREPQKRGTT